MCPWVHTAPSISSSLADYSEEVAPVDFNEKAGSETVEKDVFLKENGVHGPPANGSSATPRRHGGVLDSSSLRRTALARAPEPGGDTRDARADVKTRSGKTRKSVLASLVETKEEEASEVTRVEVPERDVARTCPYEHPLRLLFADVQRKRERRRVRATRRLDPSENIILRWDVECLGSLPRKLAALEEHLDPEERASGEIHLFRSDREKAVSARVFPQQPIDLSPVQPVVFRKGVFYSDRVTKAHGQGGAMEAHAVTGRSLALSILAGALGVRVSTAGMGACGGACRSPAKTDRKEEGKWEAEREGKQAGDVGSGEETREAFDCTEACEKELERRFWSTTIETLHATFCPLFHIDILQITNLSGVMERLGILNVSSLPGYLANTHGQRFPTHRSKLTEVAKCMKSVSPDSTGTPQQVGANVESITEYQKQWHHLRQVSDFSLWSDKAWAELTPQSEKNTPVVALLDTGCSKHEDYWDETSANSRLWKNVGENCSNQRDDDGNGYIDDCWGWNFAENNGNVFGDDSAHGTTMASLLVAKHNDSKRGVGVMKTGKIMCLKTGTNSQVYASAVIAALQYAINNGAKISVCAFTFSKLYPAAFQAPNLLVVGSSKLTGGPCCSSNWGKKSVHVFAPGNRLWTGTNVDHDAQTTACKTCAAFAYGTSGAAALTGGVAAMVWAYLQTTKPVGWTSSEAPESIRVKHALVYGSTPSYRLAGACEANGIVNMYSAMHYFDTVPLPFEPVYQDYPSIFQFNVPPLLGASPLSMHLSRTLVLCSVGPSVLALFGAPLFFA
ncbi:putative serine protease/subtilase [Neospora caninum Liverpool]|uniref:subtilisin n=1 Tax=Neospora caninum (strain Liverpool) TaxID=572307 RepID=F0VA70_NEOCL|nr:putative serine protease/subtilase [Neospora caninum Liverpool]CBZ50559.1 putative serine protease/subtilase [Neospora caninum Liverpool]CEL65170.1 TPA: serine protease/subtilase, putative [Neospora caninum Liverpool]|eukprot:XP_003880592.1 putative serine protease/subtilase [Neospora caninum Liverpool]